MILDTTGQGFVFTDPAKGGYVSFDIEGKGTPVKVSWPKVGSGNAWLVLDRDGDGVIKDGTELFGNFSPHADAGVASHPNPTGWLALQWFDNPPQGDGNLLIDKRDQVWNKLRLWIDEHCYKDPDHQCQSRPQELHTLESEGINSISLIYTPNIWSDGVGNEYRYLGFLNPEAEDTPDIGHAGYHQTCCDLHIKSKDRRLVWDVFLKAKQN